MTRNNQTPRNNNQKDGKLLEIWNLRFVCILFLGYWFFPASTSSRRGMTLIETLVAISILAVAIVAPMSLTIQSLTAAYYARDQVVAFNLAQEAIESVRSVRDGNILKIALNTSATCTADAGDPPMHLLCGIPIGTDFMIDTRDNHITRCDADQTPACDPLQTDDNPATPTNEGVLYGYDTGWDSLFTRAVHAEFVDVANNEIRITVTVTRSGGVHTFLPVILYENLYRWVEDASGI